MFEHAEHIESFKPTHASTHDLAKRITRMEEQMQANHRSFGEERRRLDEGLNKNTVELQVPVHDVHTDVFFCNCDH